MSFTEQEQNVIDGYLIAKDLHLSEKEHVELLKELEERQQKRELIAKTQANRHLAQVSKTIQKPGQSHAQAVLEALNSNPELYQP